MTDDVYGTLQTTWGVGEQVGVICNADSGGADRAYGEPKQGAVQADQARIYINFKMSTGSDMSLSVSLIHLNPSAQLVIHLHMTFCVSVGVLAVGQEVTPLPHCVELPHLDVPLH